MTNTDERDAAAPAGVTPPTTFVIAERVVAAVAAHAAPTVAGVVCLEPGLRGLAGSLARSVRQWVTGLDPAPTEGVRVRIESADVPGDVPGDVSADVSGHPARAWVEVDVVISGQDQIAAVAQAVQRAVSRAVTAATDCPVAAVTVTVLDVRLAWPGAR